MTIFPPIKELPKQYHILTMIRSVELKSKLAERISGILGLLDFFDIVEPDEKTEKLVRRFVNYLNTSCKDAETIQRRAGFLSVFAGVVYDHLLFVKYGPVITRTTAMTSDGNEFSDLVITLTETLATYHAHPQVNQPLDYLAFLKLNAIIEILPQVTPDMWFQDYGIAKRKLDELIEDVTQLSATGAHLTEDSQFLYLRLNEIYFYTERFVSHKGASLKGQ